LKIPVPVPLEQRGPDLQQRAGVFITLRKKGELRGCVGTLVAHGPLWDTVAERTLAVMASDPRFPRLTAKEGPVTLEVSLLTPLKRIRDWRHYRPGLGAVLALGDWQGILLPEVAEELGWNSQRFLENLSMKAGLSPEAYRHPKVRLYVYHTQVLREHPEQTTTPAGGFQQ